MTNFASKDLTAGELNALVKKAGGDESVRKILSGELKIQLLSTTVGVVIPAGEEAIPIDPANWSVTFEYDFDTIDEQTVKNLGRQFYGDETILQTVPKPTGKQVITLYTAIYKKQSSVTEAHQAYQAKNLTGNPWHVIAYAKINPGFADNLNGDGSDASTGVQWQDVNGKFCYVAFYRWDDERLVNVLRRDSGWDDRWRLVGSTSTQV